MKILNTFNHFYTQELAFQFPASILTWRESFSEWNSFHTYKSRLPRACQEDGGKIFQNGIITTEKKIITSKKSTLNWKKKKKKEDCLTMTVVNIAIQRISHDGILKQENNHDFKQWDSHDREVGYVSSKICHSKYDHEPAFWYVCTLMQF